MTFVGLKQRQDRINLMAYLHTLGSNLPIPAPKPAAAAHRAPPGGRGERRAGVCACNLVGGGGVLVGAAKLAEPSLSAWP